jgi:hypothetical protein
VFGVGFDNGENAGCDDSVGGVEVVVDFWWVTSVFGEVRKGLECNA